MRTAHSKRHTGNKTTTWPSLPYDAPEPILAKIHAGIKDADEGRFATDEEVQTAFARLRNAG